MSLPEVSIVATGLANTASVRAAFERLGVATRLVDDTFEVQRAQALVLPGVGAFAPAARALDDLGLRGALRQRIEENRPTLGICLGMQLFCAGSHEGVGARGLGLVPALVEPLPAGPPLPQLGWNRVEPGPGCALLEPGWAYFAHTYCVGEPPEGWNVATTEYGRTYVSAMELGRVLACQFHPELSGEWGAALLRRWLESAS
ncbi:MAG: imidazole glycerol phosphate synthase subunit HisH [Planctomycetota bacterium]|nr:imidazole glycerol phosphate synthase subunit HisH [Planctomycetota bacterium]